MPTKRLPSSIRRRGFLGGVVAASAGAFVAPPVRAQAVARAAERTDAAPSHVTFRSAEHMIGSAVNFAYAAKAGPFLFLNGQEGFDFATGVTPVVEGNPGFPDYGVPKLRREADYLVGRMGRILGEFGSDLAHSVRLDQYYTSGEAVNAYHLARFAGFGKYVPPSTSILMERCFGAHSNISTSLVAVMPDSAWEIHGVYPDNSGVSALSGYAPAVVCNDFVFAAGQMAERNVVFDPAARNAAQQNWGTAMPIRAQAQSALKRLDATLQAGGSSLANCVKAQIHIAGTHNFPDFLEVWRAQFRDSPCALTVVPAKGFATVEGIIEINLVALKNDSTRKKQVVNVDLPEMAAYGPCIRAGEFVFPSGLMPIGRDGQVAGAAQEAAFDGLCLSGQLQAAAIYDYAEAIAKAAGTSMANAVRAHYWVSDVREFPGIALAWAGRYGAAPHPFACVVSPPPMPAPGATVMADFWLYAG
jgi:enamine deaminase RidA (YjgF/YER057c/UK114 family)